MLNIFREENERLKAEIAQLRQTIINVDPTVLHDGRFEKMITSPRFTLAVARELLETQAKTAHPQQPDKSSFLFA